MKAIVTQDSSGTLTLADIPRPEAGAAECLVKLKYASLNRRDEWISKGLYPGIAANTVLGSDGCGIVEKGPEQFIGKAVMLNPNENWGPDSAVQSPKYTILGTPNSGVLTEYIAVPVDRIVVKPQYLEPKSAAAIPLAGLTAYRAVVTKARVSKGSTVLVSGVGGGVAQFAVSIASQLGCKVYVTSGSESKLEKSKDLGAIGGFVYREESWPKEALKMVGGFDCVIDGTGGDQFNNYLKVLKPGGSLVIYGATAGKPLKMDIQRLFWSQVSVVGSTMGNDEEFEQMISFFDAHKIHPMIDAVFPLERYKDAFERFHAADHFGKIIVEIDPS